AAGGDGDEVYGLATGGGGASCSLSLGRRAAWPAGFGGLLLGLLWLRRRRGETRRGKGQEVAR
ncbi:MAG: hypothetical protein KC583_05795, partial [Myxococcales bacterium]|nr:hypothetical protein [Myxococcales bacterium]